MNCPSCQRECSADAVFCSGCGQRLSAICEACGRNNPPDASFCEGCGGRLRSQAAEDAAPGPVPSPNERARDLPGSFASGRYAVQRLAGEGAKKQVYLARDAQLDRDIAFSVIKTDGLDDAGRTRVRREAQAMGRLGDHPHIVTVHDIGEEDEQLYIVSQYMAGGDLEARLAGAADRRLPIDEAVRIADEICRALEHAHQREVIHRDLKPGNVWLTEDGHALLGDFGLALSLDRSRLTQEGMMVGTAAYMPPEQALSGEISVRSDLYALGAVLYEMVAGRPPFLGDDVVTVISQHINTAPVAPSWHNPEVPRALEALILRLLAKDPSERPQSAAAVRQSLTQASSIHPEAVVSQDRAELNPLDRLAAGVFVGRDGELDQLRSAFDAALSGQGRIIMLVGEPGIGKTRTAEELATYARLRGAQLLWGRCYEGDGAPAYWPWVQIIRTYVHDREPKTLLSEMGPGAADIAEVVSDVRERLPGLPTPPRLDPDEARFRLFDSITTFLKNASSQQPLALIIDDLHWADKPSLLLLQFLARELDPSRLLVLGTYRDVELGRQHPLEQTLAELARSQLSERVLLRGLNREDVARFIELSAGRSSPPALVQAVYRETEGNPFFVHEVVQLLQSDGRLDRADEVESWSLEIPQGVRQVVGQRLSALSDECNRLLATASVMGREFELAALAKVSELVLDEVLELLEEAEDARIINELAETPDTYRFSHALIRETLYDELRTTRRLLLHRRIAEAIEDIHAAKLEPHLSQLAYHFCEGAPGGDVDKAIRYAVRAAERASTQFASEEAVAHYERALQALDLCQPPDERRRGDLLMALAVAHGDAGNLEPAQEVLLRTIDVARSIDSPELLGRATVEYAAHCTVAGTEDPEISDLTQSALSLLPEADSPARAALLALRSRQILYTDEPLQEHTRLYCESREMARRVGDVQALTFAHWAGCFLATRTPSEKLIGVDEALDAMAEGGAGRWRGWMRFQRCYVQLELGEVSGVDADLAVLDQHARRTRYPLDEWALCQVQAVRAMMLGQLDEGEQLASQALTNGVRWNDASALQYFSGYLFLLRFLQGRLAEIEPLIRQEFGDRLDFPAYGSAVALMHVTLHEETEARVLLDRLAARDFKDLRPDQTLTGVLSALAEVVVRLGDRQRAALLYDEMLPYAGRILVLGFNAGFLGAADRFLGALATVLERWTEAELHFEAALERHGRIGGRPYTALTAYGLARMLTLRGEPRDHERALELTNRALTIAREIGMAQLLDEALELKLSLQGVDPGDPHGSIYAVSSSVQDRRPNLSPHAAPDGTVTLMFSDMEGFTAMTERLGDVRAREVIREHNAIVREQLGAHHGHEVELQGDGFLLAFRDPQHGLQCAIGIQRAFAARSETAGEPIRVRIGLHTGQALKDADKFFGLTVILASRIAAQARGGEILVSSFLKELIESIGNLRFGEAREVDLKGISERQRIHAVEWE